MTFNDINSNSSAQPAETDSSDATSVDASVRTKPTWRRRLVFWLLFFGLLYALWLGMLIGCQRHMVFPGMNFTHQLTPPPPNTEVLTLQTDAGTGQAWLMLGEGRTPDTPGPAVIFAHGNGEFIDAWAHDFHIRYRPLGISVLIPEYRGYANTDGIPSQANVTDDFVRWYELLSQRPEVDDTKIVLHGRSLGGGVVANVTQQLMTLQKQAEQTGNTNPPPAPLPPAALILESTFTSITDMAARMGVPRFLSFLVKHPFEVRSVLAEYPGPTLIVHGTEDEIIPVQNARDNHDAAKHTDASTLILYPGMTHNVPVFSAFWTDMPTFLNEHGILNLPE